MQNTIILHHGALTVELDSAGTVILHEAGKCPTLDEIARHRALNTYIIPQEPTTTHTSEEL
jgi:hypothetical protein